MEENGTILFRNLGVKVPPGWLAGATWQVEFYPPGDRGFPSGVAWVFVPPGRQKVEPGDIYLKYIIVADDQRREGIATRLVEAIRARWPGVSLGQPISRAGAALWRKFRPPPQPEHGSGRRSSPPVSGPGVPLKHLRV